MNDLVELFTKIGLDKTKAEETTRNAKLSSTLKDVLHQAGLNASSTPLEKSKGMLLYQVATKVQDSQFVPFLVNYVVADKLRTSLQVDAALDYIKKNSFDLKDAKGVKAFEDATGVHADVSLPQITAVVKQVMAEYQEALLSERYYFNVGLILQCVRDRGLKWADGKLVKEETDRQLAALLGPKTADDLKPRPKTKATPAAAVATIPAKASNDEPSSASRMTCNGVETHADAVRAFEGSVLKFHRPEENKQLRQDILDTHLRATGGKVVTRFPPEPNGFLHIGHAKAINLSFRYAEANDGICYLRYDDTNPEAEEMRFFISIRECVEWLGFTPFKVTHSSDYFPELYDLALALIEKGKAFVCHQTPEEMHASRGGDHRGPRTESPWRNRSVADNLTEFKNMKEGLYEEGQAVLRMKIDMQSGNPYMWDPVAYRILNTPHPRTGSTWRIYPTYDFTHCLCDSMENITHSLCTTEFALAREAYYWLCDALEVYRPVQWEYGRLNITNTVLSKRKLQKLVEGHYVTAWDDPRLFTLPALRRRGFTAKAINTFVERVGITTSQSMVDVKLLESCVRDDLNNVAQRVMAVLDPIRVEITNYPENEVEYLTVPNMAHLPEKGDHKIPFSRVIYIDRQDFREDGDRDPHYYRLAPGRQVGLHRAYTIRCDKVIHDADHRVIGLQCTYDRSCTDKVKAHIHWVSEVNAVKANVNMYSSLFMSKQVGDGWLNDINPDSLTVIENAMIDGYVNGAKAEDKFQFERVGYFCVDTTSTAQKLVFNLTVNLKEDSRKQ